MGLTKPRAAQIYDIDYKQATRVVTVTNITLSGGAPSQVDSVNLSKNDRVLVIGQSTASQNGIYYVSTLGTGSNGTWTRSLDTDVTGELLAGTIVMVTEGTNYHDTQWKLTSNDPIVIGTTPLYFEQNSVYAYGNVYANGTAIVATQVGDTITLTPGNNMQITANVATKTVTFDVTGVVVSNIGSGSSNVNVNSAGGNVSITIAGNLVTTFANTGVYTVGINSVTGNIYTGGNLFVTGTSSLTGNTTAGHILPAANGTYDLGSASNKWRSIYVGGNTIYIGNGNITSNSAGMTLTNDNGGFFTISGNGTSTTLSANVVTATGNVTGGNIYTGGVISATGNISTAGNITTAAKFYGDGGTLSNIYAFSNVLISGGSTISAGNIKSLLTLQAGNSINITGSAETGVITIAYSGGGGGSSIFATGGDMGLVTEAVTSSEDLALITEAVTVSYDLGGIGISGFVSTSDILPNTVIGNQINSSTYISITGNITAANANVISSTYDVRGWWTTGLSKTVSAQETLPTSVIVDNSFGTNMYVVGSFNDRVYQYTLSSPWDVSTANYASKSFLFTSQDTSPQDIVFNSSYSVMYMIGATTASIYQYNMTAYDVSTASYASLSYSVGSQESSPTALAIQPNGANVYVIGSTNKTVYQYNLGTAGNIATASYTTRSFSVASQDTAPTGLQFSTDGLTMWVVGNTADKVYQYTLSEAWNVSTSSYVGFFYVGDQNSNAHGLYVNISQLKAWVVGQSPVSVVQYNTGNSTIQLSNSAYYSSSVQSAGNIYGSGNVTGSYLLGNGYYITGIQGGSNIQNGNSNIIASANSNITVGVAGTASIATFANTGLYVTGVVSATGNISAANYLYSNGTPFTFAPVLNITMQQNYGGF